MSEQNHKDELSDQFDSIGKLFTELDRQRVKRGESIRKATTCMECGGQAVVLLYPRTWGGKPGIGIRGSCINECWKLTF
ncbi:hypothetical protein H1S01_09425 [Heliobacterium chlorum]|uniref:Uncharacterized protein n=1 Tax=Heliobacterium chlorum TaxID=2698 RepID=A0ABR7T1R9_HELCL|nr:hypothetical protein [Heliobacterium chlorum]MBC9784729.1 hypothetical protein [Heliobacterium chlorum]